MRPYSFRYFISLCYLRYLAAVVVLFLFQNILFAQSNNLVPNPSFEEAVNFDRSTSEFNWTKCLKNDTPDYIEFTSRGEPEFYYSKYIGGLLPYDGEAYTGIFCFRTNELRGISNIREFIQITLRETLKKDTLYRVSLAIALDPESTTAINNFNVCFTREPLDFKKEKQMFELSPQISFKESFLESETWVILETTYRAKGYESQLILGNFLADNQLRKKRVAFDSQMQKKWDLHELERASYYYIDMVRIIKNSEWEEKVHFKPSDGSPDKEQNEITPPPQEENPDADTSYIEIDKVKRDSSIVMNNIFFEFDKSELLPDSYIELNRLYIQLQEFSDLSIIIEGHTDNMGTYEYNMQLSNKRARAVVDYLLEKGLSGERITSEGYGYTRPLSDNRQESGRQLNRRVAFRINQNK